MQTFLPYPNFPASAQCLDRQRLGKQRVEVLQILNVLTNPDARGWANHPAVKTWRGYEGALARYGLDICREWTSRGYKDTCAGKILAMNIPDSAPPPWLGDPAFHLAHRSNLVAKMPAHYAPLWPDVEPGLEYVWPV